MKLWDMKKIQEKFGYKFDIAIDEVVILDDNDKLPELGTIGDDRKYVSNRLLVKGTKDNIDYSIIFEEDHCHHYYKDQYMEDKHCEKTILYLDLNIPRVENFVTYEHYTFMCNEFNAIRHQLKYQTPSYDELQFIPLDERQFKKCIDNGNTPYLFVYGVKLDEYGSVEANELLFHLDIIKEIGIKFAYFRQEKESFNL